MKNGPVAVVEAVAVVPVPVAVAAAAADVIAAAVAAVAKVEAAVVVVVAIEGAAAAAAAGSHIEIGTCGDGACSVAVSTNAYGSVLTVHSFSIASVYLRPVVTRLGVTCSQC